MTNRLPSVYIFRADGGYQMGIASRLDDWDGDGGEDEVQDMDEGNSDGSELWTVN